MKGLVFLLSFVLVAGAKETAERPKELDLLFQAEALGIISSKQLEQLLHLSESGEEKFAADFQDDLVQDAEEGVFTRMYNRLTLLNVLYFGGALLVMGAYSLFMTLAVEHFNMRGLSVVMIAQTLASGVAGHLLWTTDYQFLGGLLCTVSTSMVPFTTYCIERAMNLWPKADPGVFQNFRLFVQPRFVVMELATVLVGSLYLARIQFPFLLAPVSFSLWFLSMDLAPWSPQWDRDGPTETRRQISLLFGLGLLALGRIVEQWLGANPDFGFWLYLFGLITFWFALSTSPQRNSVISLSLYFLINVALVSVGSHLDRNTFKLFGGVGVVLVAFEALFNSLKFRKSRVLWVLKALAAASLLAQALKYQGNVELLSALACYLAFNMESILYITSGEHYELFVLFTDIGFVACAPTFVNFQLDVYLFAFNAGTAVAIFLAFPVAVYHITVVKEMVKKYPSQRADYSQVTIVFLAWRVVVSVAVSLIMAALRLPQLAFVGALGIPIVSLTLAPRRAHGQQIVLLPLTGLGLLVLGVAFSQYLQSNQLYLICNLAMAAFIYAVMNWGKKGEAVGCLLSVLLILVAVPLQSKLMLTIAVINIFLYLSYLAYSTFKDSFLFPIVLIFLGMGLIGLGILYQYWEDTIYLTVMDAVPISTRHFGWQDIYDLSWDWYLHFADATFSWESVRGMPLVWLPWSGALVHALAQSTVFNASLVWGVGIFVMLVTGVILHSLEKHLDQVAPDLTSKVKVTDGTFSIILNQSGEKNGMVVSFRGCKPTDLDLPKHIALDVRGDTFWEALESKFSSFAINIFRSAFLPCRLTPHLIEFKGYTNGSAKFSSEVFLGTGRKGMPAIKHSTIAGKLPTLRRVGATLTCVLLYSNSWFLPYRPLCSYSIQLSSICDSLT